MSQVSFIAFKCLNHDMKTILQFFYSKHQWLKRDKWGLELISYLSLQGGDNMATFVVNNIHGYWYRILSNYRFGRIFPSPKISFLSRFYCRTGQTCISSKTKLKSIPILFGECGIGTGKCEKVCSTITVEEDVECFCGCDLKR